MSRSRRTWTAGARAALRLGVLALVFAGACSQSEERVTQVIVGVDADDLVKARLKSAKLAVYDSEQPGNPPDERTIELNETKRKGTVQFPFSFSVRKNRAQQFVLVVTGYERAKGVGEPVIEQKALIGFTDGESRTLRIYLSNPCLDQICESDDAQGWQTCFATLAGECGDVPEPSTLPATNRGGELQFDAAIGFATATPDAAAATPDSGPVTDGGLDSGAQEAGADAAPPAEAGSASCGPDLLTLDGTPCPSNSRCDMQSGARCVCNSGFEDDGQGGCRNKNDCLPGACQNGDCRDGIGDFSCDCRMGFTGSGSKLCTATLHCPQDACVPGGTCVDATTWSCNCASGFSGTGSQTCLNIDDCPKDRCKAPAGTCRDAVNAYTCVCADGYSGTDCEIDACSPNPCQHAGVCSRTALGASCACGTTSGFGGPRCANDIDECASANVCSADYPCVQTTAPGYDCQGQFAGWHMPDAMPGSKYAPSYDASRTPGIVYDNVTGLVWQRTPPTTTGAAETTYAGCTGMGTLPGQLCSWSEAKTYCNNLVLAGSSDWRLPSKIELDSLVDELRASPMIDTQAFANAPAASFWSSSPYAHDLRRAWFVSFADGKSEVGLASAVNHARCVRSGALAPPGTPVDRYIVDALNNTITDVRTELVWQRVMPEIKYSWDAAAELCRSRGTGWRIPSLKELLTLVDPMRPMSVPATDIRFPNTVSDGTLSASLHPTPGVAWYVDFEDGSSDFAPMAGNTGYVRCVR